MNITLAISSGIAAYKTPQLVRDLQRAGHSVRCLLSKNADKLVSKHSLAVVSQHKVYDSVWSDDGSMPHIDLARFAQLFLIAPATAHCLASCANGSGDDLISTCYLALEPNVPIFIAPAMNTQMWQHPATQRNCQQLIQDRQAQFIGPRTGELACGEVGSGAMAEPNEIIAAIADLKS